MNALFMVIFIGIAITVVFKVVHLIYLLFKLGFSFQVIKLLFVVGVIVIFVVFTLLLTDYSTTGFVLSSLVGGAILPSLFETTKVKPKSRFGKKKPKNVSDSSYAWSFYGGGNGDCGDVGFSSGSSSNGSFSSDSGDCGGGGGD